MGFRYNSSRLTVKLNFEFDLSAELAELSDVLKNDIQSPGDGATFITRQWIADKIRRSTRFVTEWWERSYDDCFADYSQCGRKLKLSDTSQNLIRNATGKQKRSSYTLVKEIAAKYKEYVTPKTIDNYRHREGLKPFHVIPKPLKTETHISDRLWLCDWLRDWTQEDFLHLAPSDEFYVWTIRRPNYQNDRVWARSIEDIEDDIKIS
ncbi:unnamed protein product [Didymodactylos carnosus]|uniref:Transposase n=1 Tax=Didymodactylos carnosus TaxID=1234261 RepID=A0A8S2D5W9_9BILA|nr:unnamed protein product [Didymodactylos carnosus]CAF3636173.1 unnamed protein product [Didymodactylos carnosus]